MVISTRGLQESVCEVVWREVTKISARNLVHSVSISTVINMRSNPHPQHQDNQDWFHSTWMVCMIRCHGDALYAHMCQILCDFLSSVAHIGFSLLWNIHHTFRAIWFANTYMRINTVVKAFWCKTETQGSFKVVEITVSNNITLLLSWYANDRQIDLWSQCKWSLFQTCCFVIIDSHLICPCSQGAPHYTHWSQVYTVTHPYISSAS